MKSNIRKWWLVLGIFTMLLFTGCQEKDFSQDYDIALPVSTIVDFNPKTQLVGEKVTLYGENLDMVSSLFIGSSACQVVSKEPGTLVFVVPRTAEQGTITVLNKYKREFISAEKLTPTYLDVTVTQWPKEIERGMTLNITGTNVDMIESVKFGTVKLSKAAATTTTATFSTANLELPESGVLTVTTKTGQTLISPTIQVVAPKDTYIPAPTIMVFDFDNIEPTIVPGNATGAGAAFTAGKNLGGIDPMFGNYYSVIAPLGNAWNGNYQFLESTNGGKGFDLTNYNKPYITFLVNTNGKQGYFNPELTINGSGADKHFTGQDGEYSDNYRIKTNGWEWRSYDLEKMGFANVKSVVSKINLFVRGGNVGNGNSEAFELHIDQVMITDGPLNPIVAFDFESATPFTGSGGSNNGGSGITKAAQGNRYFTVKDPNTGTWSGKGSMTKADNNGSKYGANKTFYVNYLINTGNDGAQGYFQLIFEQAGGTKLGMHFKGSNPYKDDYKFANTAGKWVWRSYRIDPDGLENWGSVPSLNLSAPFNFTVDFTSGNVSGKYETNVDYVILTSVPLDASIQ
ncbi:MAG: hypothetical protein QM727_05705 [Niabella sp.]